MYWLECIRLRSGKKGETEILHLIREFESELKAAGHLMDWKVYRHATLGGDYSIFLEWETEQVELDGSTVGLSLINHLSNIGIVDHSIWVAPNPAQEKGVRS